MKPLFYEHFETVLKFQKKVGGKIEPKITNTDILSTDKYIEIEMVLGPHAKGQLIKKSKNWNPNLKKILVLKLNEWTKNLFDEVVFEVGETYYKIK